MTLTEAIVKGVHKQEGEEPFYTIEIISADNNSNDSNNTNNNMVKEIQTTRHR